MKEYIHFAIFAIGFIWNIMSRISFERRKEKHQKEYISLYREYNTFLIIFFLALSIDYGMRILEIEL